MFHPSACPAAVFRVGCGGGPGETDKGSKKNICVCLATVHPQRSDQNPRLAEYLHVTFMSFTMAWNNPPSAPHSFSTDSMVSETNKKKAREETRNTPGMPRLSFVHPLNMSMLVSIIRGCEATQPAACRAHEQKQMCGSGPPAASPTRSVASRVSPLGGSGRVGAVWWGLKPPENVEGTCTVAPHNERK